MNYNHRTIEKRVRVLWTKKKLYEPDLKKSKNPFYNLMMFPYPSAEGLHVGNMYAFVGSDIYGRFQRMQGFDVFEPIGLDGFGIHSENYALKIGQHPMKLAKKTEKRFYEQLSQIGNGFAWNERLETYDPEYYRWTQWIFVQLFKRGLAYRKKALVNWCPSCQTVLADEQVIAGACERCGTIVVKKELEQWFFKITDYAERLLSNIQKLNWSEKVKIAQRNWIGKSEGALIRFRLSNISGQENEKHYVDVFTTRPDTLFGATYVAVSPELAKKWLDVGWQAGDDVKRYIANALVRGEAERIAEGREKTGIDSGIFATNPANQEKIPVWIAEYVLGGVGTGAIMAVPAHDQRDFEFAKKFNLPARMVICPHYPATTCPVLDSAYDGAGHLVDSGKFNGMKSEEAKKAITDFVGGETKTNYRLRDWLISRQRYWGPPIPMIYCKRCEWVPVSEKDLPVVLPFIKDFRPKGTGESPLAANKKFFQTRCPQCGSLARRETDVSDTFLDSAWYFFRYLDIKNKKEPFNKHSAKKWLPVHMYIGGAEHSVLHLLYTRFLTMVFNDMDIVDFEEPFAKFRAHGLLIKDGAKMSKSKGNVVHPDEYIKKYGIDTFRIYLMFLGPFSEGGDFRDSGIAGITRFLNRAFKFVSSKLEILNSKKRKTLKKDDTELERRVHETIKKVTKDIEELRYNTAISALMILLNEYEAHADSVTVEYLCAFLKLLAPFAPFMTDELWEGVEQKSKIKNQSIHVSGWPEYDPRFLKKETYLLIVQINGKVRDQFEVSSDASQNVVEELTKKREKVKIWLAGKQVKKVIFVPGKLINLVV